MNRKIRRAVAAGAVLCGVAAAVAQPVVIEPGLDYWKQAQPATVRFAPSSDIPPIPPEFFGPGSLPFEGTVLFGGDPADPAATPADTIVQRLAPASVPLPGATTIPIEIMELRLTSVAPITVNTPGGPTQWDIELRLVPGGPDTGAAQIFRDLTGNTFGYQFQMQPLFTFRSTTGTPTLTLPTPPITVVTELNARWEQVPPPSVLLLPNMGPNFFPTTMNSMTSLGSGLAMTLMPAFGADCNGNGIIDAQDLNGTGSFDANRDRVPDECQASVDVLQLSFRNRDAGYTARFSEYGQLQVHAIEPAHGQVAWFNAAVNGVWSVQNMPMHELNSSGSPWTWAPMFNLGSPRGTPVTLVNIQWSITTQPQTLPPTTPVITLPVTETDVTFGERNAIPGSPAMTPSPAVNYINPALFFPWEIIARRDMPGVNEMVDGCAPGGAARSLSWMDDLYCLNFGADCDTAQELYDILKDAMHMMTGFPGGTNDPKIVSGIQKLIDDKMLGSKLSVQLVYNPSPTAVYDALAAGKDVLGLIGWTGPGGGGHVITVTGAVKCGDHVVIDYSDDATGGDHQGDGMADSGRSKTAPVNPNPGGGSSLGGLPGNTWDGFVQICPTRLVQLDSMLKWLDGDTAMGGFTEGAIPLGEEILGGRPPTFVDFLLLRAWACDALDSACFLKKQVDDCGSAAAQAAAARIKAKALSAKLHMLDYYFGGDPIDLALALAEFDAAFRADVATVRAAIDCNHNGVDDKADISRGTSFDANHDMIPDECQCLADWNNSGTVTVQDLFDFLASFFGPGGADFNHSGATTVQDLFDYLAAYFAGCG